VNKRFLGAFCLIAGSLLLSACGEPPPATFPPSPTASESAATAVSQPTPVGADTPTAAPPTQTPVPLQARIAVQLPDNTVALVDAAGKVTSLGQTPVSLSGVSWDAAFANDIIFARSIGLPPGAYAIDATGARPLDALGPNINGLAAWPGQAGVGAMLAWGAFTMTGSIPSAFIYVGAPDGLNARAVVNETGEGLMTNPMPVRFSQDGQRLFYSSEPTGIGGYILFGGYSNLHSLSINSGVTSTLIANQQLGMLCIDEFADDDNTVLYHCGDKSIGVLNLNTGATTAIQPPAAIMDAAALGTARLSPDHTRVAFALARRNPDDEQGWLAVSNGLSGEAALIVTSAPGGYLSVGGWLDGNTIIFQRSALGGQTNTPPSVWAVQADGNNARKLTDGTFLTLAKQASPVSVEYPGGVLAARRILAQQLHLRNEDVKIVRFEAVDWKNGCLGMQTVDMMCTEAIVPGFRVILEAQGQPYEYHTNQNGSKVVLAVAPAVELQDAGIEWQGQINGCQLARMNLNTVVFGSCGGPLLAGKYSGDTRASAYLYFVDNFTPFQADTVAGHVVLTGTGVTIASPAQQRMVAEFARLAAQEAAAGRTGAAIGTVIGWHREGGIAGFCDDVVVTVTGEAYVTTCKGGSPQAIGMLWLTSEQAQQVFDWADRFKTFEITHEGAVNPDELVIRMVFAGTGTEEATDADKQAISAFMQALLDQAKPSQ
jgi:hypothetical protein